MDTSSPLFKKVKAGFYQMGVDYMKSIPFVPI